MSSVESRLRERVEFLEEQVRQYRVALSSERCAYTPLGLPRQQTIVLAALMRGGVKSRAVLEAAIDCDQPSEDGRCEGHIVTVVSRLRSYFRASGVGVRAVYGGGYIMDDGDRHRVRALCEAGVRLAPTRVQVANVEVRT